MVHNMGLKRSIIDLVIVLSAGIGIYLVLKNNTNFGILLIVIAIVFSFWRSLGYTILKKIGL